MNPPRWWIIKRPGICIPVFFFVLVPILGNAQVWECASAALGNTFLVRTGYGLPGQNQAGLGQVDRNSVSVQHVRPALCPDLGITTLSAQLATQHGAIGSLISHDGIKGLGFTSAWLAYGITVSKGWTAGVGIHFRYATTKEKWIHHPAFSFAAGIQTAISERLTLGAHVSHPAGWYATEPPLAAHPMTITVGGCWMILPMIHSFWEVEMITGYPLRWKLGIEWEENRGLGMQMGIHSQPLTVSGGMAIDFGRWNIHMAFTYRFDKGTTPYSAISYAW